jgi:hypothetical protein
VEGPEVELAGELVSRGYAYGELARLAGRGELVRIRRGAYAEVSGSDAAATHRQLIAATMPRLARDACLSHTSAALLHGLPHWDNLLGRVHVIRPRATGGRRGRLVHVHPAALVAGDVVDLDGYRTTSLARTVADCARTLPYVQGVSLGDAALRFGLGREDLAEVLGRPGTPHGNQRARRVAAFIDRRAESVGESYSRVTLHRMGIPQPELQFEVVDQQAGRVAFSDFGWPAERTLGEFDGKIKYGRLVRSDQTAGEVIYAEKLREDWLRGLGWEIVRWGWDDLSRPNLLAGWLYRAFDRGRRRAD